MGRVLPRIAQVALRFGADDIDGAIVEERIYHDAGASTAQGLRRAELLQLIRKAARQPIERAESTFTAECRRKMRMSYSAK